MIYYSEFDNTKGEHLSVTIGTLGDKSLDFDLFDFNQMILEDEPLDDTIVLPLDYVFSTPYKRMVTTNGTIPISGTVVSSKDDETIEWDIIEYPSWIRNVAKSEDKFNFTVGMNITDSVRKGIVKLRQHDSGKELNIEVLQAQAQGDLKYRWLQTDEIACEKDGDDTYYMHCPR